MERNLTVRYDNIKEFCFCFGVEAGSKLIWQLKMEMVRGEEDGWKKIKGRRRWVKMKKIDEEEYQGKKEISHDNERLNLIGS